MYQEGPLCQLGQLFGLPKGEVSLFPFRLAESSLNDGQVGILNNISQAREPTRITTIDDPFPGAADKRIPHCRHQTGSSEEAGPLAMRYGKSACLAATEGNRRWTALPVFYLEGETTEERVSIVVDAQL